MPTNSLVYDALSGRSNRGLTALGQRLRVARQRRGWTQEVLSEKAGLSVGTLKKIEAGNPRVPFGFWVHLMDTFAMVEDIDKLAMPENDRVGKSMEGNTMRQRVRVTNQDVGFDFGENGL